MLVGGLFVGRYVGLHGRADQEAFACLGVILAAVGLSRVVRACGLTARAWPVLITLGTGAALAGVLLPDAWNSAEPDLDELLLHAAQRGDDPQVRDLLARGASPNASLGPIEHTPLLVASTEGHARVVEALLRAGGDPNQATREGTTSLMAAALRCHFEVARLLLQSGADVDVRARSGLTALDLAENCPAVVELLDQ